MHKPQHSSKAVPQRERTSPALLWAALVGVGIAWGLATPLAKYATSTEHHPTVAAFWNIVVAALLVTVVGAIQRPNGRTLLSAVGFFFACGLLGRALPVTLVYVVSDRLAVGLIVLLLSTTPLLTLVLAASLGADRLDTRKTLGLGLGLLGIAIVMLGSANVSGIDDLALASVPLLVALAYALEATLIRVRKPPALDTLAIVLGTTWAALVLLLPISLMHDAFSILRDPGLVEAAIAAGAVLHLCGYCGFVWLIGQAGPVFTSQVGYIVTATGIVTGILMFDEHHGPAIWVAMALMTSGLFLVRPSR